MMTADQIAELEAKHGEIAILNGPAGAYQVAFRKPTRAEYRLFRANIHNPQKVAEAQEALGMATVVYPDRTAYVALIEKFYAIPDTKAFSDAMNRLMHLAAEEQGKG